MSVELEHAVEALAALSRGDYRPWMGLPAGFSREQAEAALGSSLSQDETGMLLGQYRALRRYPRTAGASFGVRLWFADSQALLVEVQDPTPSQPLEVMIGEPEKRIPSLLGTTRDQWIYASRGLSLHVSRITGDVFRLYGFKPCTVEAFLKAPLSQVALHRSLRTDK